LKKRSSHTYCALPINLGVIILLLFFDITFPSIFCSRYAKVTDITSERRLGTVIVNREWQTAEMWSLQVVFKGRNNRRIIKCLREQRSRTLAEMEVSSSLTNPKSQLDSTCRNATVYFQWSWLAIMLRLYEATRTYMICWCPLPVPVRSFNCF
jgi:hypothetical protein